MEQTLTNRDKSLAVCRSNPTPAVQRKAVRKATTGGEMPPVVNAVLRSPGQPLDAETRAFMEPRFRRDFSGVRVHTDAQAAESAWAVSALAYTVERDIVFGAGQYAPGTTQGRRLLAHELAHVVQQGDFDHSDYAPTRIASPDSIGEQEASAFEHTTSTQLSPTVPGVLQRKVKGDDAGAQACGGARTCASGVGCGIADNAIIGPMPPSTWWKLTVMVDVEAPTAADVTESTPGHAYVKFSDSNGTLHTYGFYPDPLRPPNFFRTRTTGCVVHPDTIHERCVDYREEFSLDERKHHAALSLAHALCQATPAYDLQTFNCTTFADRIVRAAGKSLPAIRGVVGSGMFKLPADNPNTLLEGLRARDAARAHGGSTP